MDPVGAYSDEHLRRIGERVLAGARKPRRDALARLIEAVLVNDITLTWSSVLKRMERYDTRPDDPARTIEEIDEAGRIYWIDRRGREQSTSCKSFQNRVASIRSRLIREAEKVFPA